MLTQPQNPRSILPANDVLANTSLPQQVPNKLCEYCNINRRTTRASGILSRYCDTECAKLARARMPARVNQYRENFAPEDSEGNLCAVCKERPRLDDGIEGVYDFCSRACADAALKSQSPVALQTGRVDEDKGEFIKTLLGKYTFRKTSVLPGCILSPNNNEVGGYCAKGCLEQTNAPPATGSECLRCKMRIAVKFGFCSDCITKVEDNAPCILPVPKGHVIFRDVQKQFKSSWRHPVPEIPAVQFVYKVISTKEITDKYESYKREVERRRNCEAQNKEPGNERRRWHGTRRACNIGDPGNTECCILPNCALCSIMRNSFLMVHIKNNRTWKRFGMGFYTTSTSSKANDYSKNVTPSRYKAILLNRVVVGRGCKLTIQDETLTEPPPGYDSVLGEKGEKLNYDELIVYREDALLPSYLIIYDNTSHSTLQK